ncbi:hypothetical protein F503_07320 [Ophiostoma piceae UAMH 11346]|uniref:Vacuolar sorting protein Vps3844 C-terminal domain-containing protein n=1 Tax=Ophiostoma piceae (strain UAMH 11346) TaxID=1262450 RepID=S3C7P3_OPHP1|nr:hypothetical protein F503_07320 [Ophiostoma piceae UAMH 11346]
MKFLAGLAVAASLASSAASAAVASAPVYILSKSASTSTSSSDSTAPSVPRQIVRQILLQRLAATEASSFFDTLPRDYDADAALGLIERFGGDASSLFEGADVLARHPEMLVVVEGVTDKHVAAIEGALSASPAFTVADPPNQAANAKLFVDELAAGGIVAHKEVALAEALAPSAWINGVFVGLYDVKREPSVVDEIVKALPEIVALAAAGDADVTVVLMPEGSRATKTNVWAKVHKSTKSEHSKIKHQPTAAAIELRTDESVFIEGSDTEFDSETTFAKASSDNSNNNAGFKPVAAAAGRIPACFQSFNSCSTQTNSCSGHGKCVDKFAVNSGGFASQKGGSCFVCHCYSTLNRPEDAEGGLSTTQWAGNMCQKIDVSVPFWLITGFTVAIVGAVAFAIGLLFSVGEEKLPGVIGAGVSRSK